MSSAARFVLEFEATGDQEVVNKIKAVGAAGKQTATELESLRGIEDPFEPIATGADAAVAPIEGVGTAAGEAVTPITDMGTATDETVSILSGAGTTAEEFGGAMEGVGTAADTAVAPLEGMGTAAGESLSIFSGAGTAVGDFSANLDAVGGAADAATGGLTPANTMMGNFAESTGAAGTSATTAAGNVGEFAGSITAIGGIIGSAIGSIFRLQDAQLRLDKANLRAAKATETARKAEQAFFDLLAKAPGNREAIAAATEAYITAQETLTRLQEAGITTGAEYEAAQAAVATATVDLKAAFVAGGGEAGKFDTALNKMNLTTDAAALSQASAAKAARENNEAMLDTAFSVTSIVGTLAQFVAGSKGMIDNAKAMKAALGTGLAPVLAKLGGGIGTFSLALGGALGPMAAFAAALGPAALAVGVFLGAIKLIEHFRQPIYDFFNGIGVAIGKAIPPLKAFVTELGNAMDSSLEFLIRNTNALFGIETKTVDNLYQLLSKFQSDRQSLNDEEVKSALAIIQVSKQRGETEAETVKRILPILKLEAQGKITTAEADRLMSQTSAEAAAEKGKEAAAHENVAAVLTKARTITEGQSKALQELTGNAKANLLAVSDQTSVLAMLTAEDIKNVTAMGEMTRAQLLANAGFNNAKVAALQYQAALTAMTGAMVDDTDKKNANAQATLTLVDSELNAQNAIATVNEEYANSVDRLADLETVLGNTEAKTKAVATVSNEFAASLKEQSIELQGTLQALQDVENQEQGVANAILQTKVSLEESNQALREAKAVHDDMGASMTKVQTALNEEQTALIEEEAGLQASIAAANDSVIMRQRLDNAYLKGIDSIGQWTTELATAAEEEQGAIDALAELGFTFQDLPGYMEPTVENLKLVAEAQRGVGDAAEKMTDMAIENYNELTSASQGLADSIKDAFLEGDIEDAVQKAVDKIPPAVRKSMSDAQLEEYKGIQEMRATAEAAAIELGIDIDTEGFAAARADYTANLQDLASNSDGIWSQMWARAAEITKNGSQATVAAVKKVIEEGGGPELMLQKLNQIVTEAPGVGNKIGTALVGGVKSSFTGNAVVDQNTLSNMMGTGIASQVGQQVGEKVGVGLTEGFTGNAVIDANTMVNNIGLNELPPKAGTIGNESGTVMAQKFGEGWLTVLTAVQGVLDRIPSYIDTVAAKIKPIPLTADVSQAIQKVTEFENVLVSVQAAPIRITADISQAIQVVTEFENTLVSVEASPIIITADSTNAVAAFNRASTSSLTMRNNVTAAANGVKSAAAGAGAAVASFSSKASSSFAKAGAAGTQMANKVKSASSSMKSSLNSAASSAASFASKCVSSFNKVGSSATSNASKVNKLASAISKLKSKTITITTRYVTSGRPGGLQHGGSFIADSPTTIGGTKIGEHYKPELVTVTPLTNPNSLDKTITVNTPGGRGGGSREVVIPVTLMLDNKVLIRTVRRGLVEEVSGIM